MPALKEARRRPGAWRPDDAAVEALVAARAWRSLLRARHAPGRGRHGVGARLLAGRRRPSTCSTPRPAKQVATLEQIHPDGFFAGPIPRREEAVSLSPRPLGRPATTRGRRRTPTASRRSSASSTSTSSREGTPPPPLRAARRASRRRSTASTASPSRCGRRTRRGSASSANSTSGTAAATRCGSASRSASGRSSFPASPTAPTTSSSCSAPDGRLQPLKADPVGFRHERPPATASRVAGLVRARMARRATGWRRAARRQALAAPISIYEVHLGSWRRKNGDRVPDL